MLTPAHFDDLRAVAKTEFYLNYGQGFHSNDARGTTISVDPAAGVTRADPVQPLVRTAERRSRRCAAGCCWLADHLGSLATRPIPNCSSLATPARPKRRGRRAAMARSGTIFICQPSPSPPRSAAWCPARPAGSSSRPGPGRQAHSHHLLQPPTRRQNIGADNLDVPASLFGILQRPESQGLRHRRAAGHARGPARPHHLFSRISATKAQQIITILQKRFLPITRFIDHVLSSMLCITCRSPTAVTRPVHLQVIHYR